MCRRESESVQGPWISRIKKGKERKKKKAEKVRHIPPAGFQGRSLPAWTVRRYPKGHRDILQDW